MSLSSVHALTVPAFSTQAKRALVAVEAIATCLFTIGTLALLASQGVTFAGCFANIGVQCGLVCFFSGLACAIVGSIYIANREEKHFDVTQLSDERIAPTTDQFCCRTRFTHGAQDHRNPLLDTWENITMMHMGGFRKYPPLEEQLPELVDSSPVVPMEDKVRIRWMGHASFLIEVRLSESKTTTILTDPNWSETIPFMGPMPLYYRSLPPGLPFDETPPIDHILLSHTHRDHFDPPTLERFEKRDHPQICCPLKAKSLLSGFSHVHECNWWDEMILEDGTKITYLPCDHSSQTTALDCNEYLWGGYMISVPLDKGEWYHIYFMGDTACNINPSLKGFQQEAWEFDTHLFRDIAESFPQIDCMLYPVDPVIGQEDKHSNVYQGIDLMRRKLNPQMIIPMHCETWPFNEFGRDLLGPRRIFTAALKEEDEELFKRLHPLKVGESLTLIPKD